MNKIKNIIITLTVFIISAVFSVAVFGATSTFTMSVDGPSNAKKGSSITLTYTASDLQSISNGFAGYEGYINYDTSKLEFVNATNSITGWVIYTNKLTGKIKFMGYDDNPPNNAKYETTEIFKATFNVLSSAPAGDTTLSMNTIKGSTGSGIKVIANDFSKTITIGDSTTSKSSNANLSSLSVSGYTLSPEFNEDVTSYKVTVPNNVTSVDVSALAQDSKANVVVTGNGNLSVGKNNVMVEVTAEDGSKKVYVVEVTRAADQSGTGNSGNQGTGGSGNNTGAGGSNQSGTGGNKGTNTGGTTSSGNNATANKSKSSNANLKSVSGIPELEFNPDKTTYDVVIPFEVTELNVSALAQDPKAKVNISNSTIKNMEVGKPVTVTIVVTAEDSTVKVYTINVKRSEYRSETDLKEFVVNKEDLLQQDNDTGEYTITVDKNTDKLDISAIPKAEGATVKIKGNENLKSGKNTVVVEVTDKNGFTKSYTIDAYKEEDSGFISFIKDYWILLLFGLLLLLLIFLILYLNRNNKTIVYNNNTRIIDNKKLPPMGLETEDTKQLGYVDENVIDNDENILYNSNEDSKMLGNMDLYEPKHADDTTIVQSDKINLDSVIDDDDVSKVKKEVTIVKDELLGDDLVEKEYTITENYRKK